MSDPPHVRPPPNAEPERRPVLRPASNNTTVSNILKTGPKPSKKPDKPEQKEKNVLSAAAQPSPVKLVGSVVHVLQHQEMAAGRNSAMTISCSSDASSSDSSQGRGSSRKNVVGRRKVCGVKVESESGVAGKVGGCEIGGMPGAVGSVQGRRRCAWVTPNTDPSYVAFHDEEWGVPVHDDKRLFELLCLSGALSELTWPVILSKRHIFREVFLDFDPSSVSKLNEKKLTAPGSQATLLLSELKLRAIFENARQMCKIIEEFGSFDKYVWNFVNNNPLTNSFKYPRQVPVKTSKAEFISKDMVKRGFRSVSPTVVYSFMQVAGLTNDHLVGCFRFHECGAHQSKIG